ncbi:hypothetical protein [Streptomyces sp. NPDC002785]|uniref:hypothetical protein n=1 Tax=Streptomyces sp. NPDC002785 TaxID=3154543 RepID=UPI003328CB42
MTKLLVDGFTTTIIRADQELRMPVQRTTTRPAMNERSAEMPNADEAGSRLNPSVINSVSRYEALKVLAELPGQAEPLPVFAARVLNGHA